MTITFEDARMALEETVALMGSDYVYKYPKNDSACYYGDDTGAPSCIVGHVVHKLAPESYPAFLKFEQYEEPFSVCEVGGMYNDTTPYPTLDATEDAIKLLNLVQVRQDVGSSWGAAVANALMEFATPVGSTNSEGAAKWAL